MSPCSTITCRKLLRRKTLTAKENKITENLIRKIISCTLSAALLMSANGGAFAQNKNDSEQAYPEKDIAAVRAEQEAARKNYEEIEKYSKDIGTRFARKAKTYGIIAATKTIGTAVSGYGVYKVSSKISQTNKNIAALKEEIFVLDESVKTRIVEIAKFKAARVAMWDGVFDDFYFIMSWLKSEKGGFVFNGNFHNLPPGSQEQADARVLADKMEKAWRNTGRPNINSTPEEMAELEAVGKEASDFAVKYNLKPYFRNYEEIFAKHNTRINEAETLLQSSQLQSSQNTLLEKLGYEKDLTNVKPRYDAWIVLAALFAAGTVYDIYVAVSYKNQASSISRKQKQLAETKIWEVSPQFILDDESGSLRSAVEMIGNKNYVKYYKEAEDAEIEADMKEIKEKIQKEEKQKEQSELLKTKYIPAFNNFMPESFKA